MRLDRRAALAALFAVLAGCSGAPSPPPPPGDVVAFLNARVIPGDGNAPIENAVLVVAGGRFTQVGPPAAVAVPVGVRQIDLGGRTVMPLLVNVHGHIGYMRGATTDRRHYSRENVLDHLRRFAYYGVGVFQALGTDRDGVELAVRDDQRSGRLPAADLALLFTSGPGLVAPTPGATNGGPAFAADVIHESASAEDARAYVRTLAASRPDMMKIWVDDRNGTKRKLAPAVYRAAIEEAHAHGIRVVAHVFYLDDAKDLVRAGVDGLAHMVRAAPGVDDDLAAMMRSRGTFACSTMSIQKPLVDGPGWLDDPALAETVPAAVIAEWKASLAAAPAEAVARARETYARLEASMRTLTEAGVRVVLCGDTGLNTQVPGFTEHRELEAIVRAGVPPLQAIRAATHVGAEVLMLPDLGTITVGKRADFLVLTADPLEDIANTRRIDAVYRGGVALDRAGMRRAWLGEAPRATSAAP